MMKLIENPIRLNASLHKIIPNTVRHLYGSRAIKFFTTYTLGAVHVYYIDAFSQIDIVMTNDSRRITDDQINFVIEKLMPDVARTDIEINQAAKAEIESETHKKLKRFKDLVIIEHKID